MTAPQRYEHQCFLRQPKVTRGICAPTLLRLCLWPPHKQPVVDVAEGVRHERLRLIVPPLTVHDELVLMVPARAAPALETCGRLLLAAVLPGNQQADCVPHIRTAST